MTTYTLWRVRERKPIGGLGALLSVGFRDKAPGGKSGGRLRLGKLTQLGGQVYEFWLTKIKASWPSVEFESRKSWVRWCIKTVSRKLDIVLAVACSG